MNHHKPDEDDHRGDPADVDIVKKIRNGEVTAFSGVFKLYYKGLFQFAGRLVKDAQIAEDLVQGVFVQIWSNREKLNITTSLRAYLYTSVRNRAINHFRHLEVKERYEVESSLLEQNYQTPEEELIAGELEKAFYQALDELPAKARQIFLMKKIDGLKYTEIAEANNISINTVKTQVTRAARYLHKRLAHLLSILPF